MLLGCGYGLGDLFFGVFGVEKGFLFSPPVLKFPVGFNRLKL
jgi:hypothetical protein